MKLMKYYIPKSAEEAYELLIKSKRNIILGGGCFTGILRKKYNIGLNLEKLELKYIKKENGKILIGSNSTLREVQTNLYIKSLNNGILSKSIGDLGAGIQLKNMATIGASVYSKYGFSDIMPVLLVLDAKLRFYNIGLVSVEEYMKMDSIRDILLEIVIEEKKKVGLYISRRINSVDIPQLNMAILFDEEVKVAIGARPQKAIRCDYISRYLYDKEYVNNEDIDKLKLGDNLKASKEVRTGLLNDMLIEARSIIGDKL